MLLTVPSDFTLPENPTTKVHAMLPASLNEETDMLSPREPCIVDNACDDNRGILIFASFNSDFATDTLYCAAAHTVIAYDMGEHFFLT